MLSYEEARRKVIEQVGKMRGPCATTSVSVWDVLGLVLAQGVKTDREYPPFDRSTRDGYAVRSKEIKPGAPLKCAGEIKAGDAVTEALPEGTCVQIMTGAAVPAGAGADVMVQHTQRQQRLACCTGSNRWRGTRGSGERRGPCGRLGRKNRTWVEGRRAGAGRRRFDGEIRSSRKRAKSAGGGVFLRRRGDSSGEACSIRDLPGKARVRFAG